MCEYIDRLTSMHKCTTLRCTQRSKQLVRREDDAWLTRKMDARPETKERNEWKRARALFVSVSFSFLCDKSTRQAISLLHLSSTWKDDAWDWLMPSQLRMHMFGVHGAIGMASPYADYSDSAALPSSRRKEKSSVFFFFWGKKNSVFFALNIVAGLRLRARAH